MTDKDKMREEFEVVATRFGLNLSANEYGYLFIATSDAWKSYQATNEEGKQAGRDELQKAQKEHNSCGSGRGIVN